MDITICIDIVVLFLLLFSLFFFAFLSFFFFKFMTPAIANLCSNNCYLERTPFSIKYRSILDTIYRSVHQFSFFVYIYFQYLLIGLFTTSTIYVRFILLYIREHSSVLYAILFFRSLLFSKFKGPREPGSRFLVTPCHTYA